MKFLLVLCAVFAVGCGTPEEDSINRLVVGAFVNCMESDLSLCLKEHALKATTRLGTVRKLKITNSITLINNDHREGKSLEPLSPDLETRRQQVSQRLWASTAEILRNSDLEYTFSDDDDDEEEEESRAIGDEARIKKKKHHKKMIKKMILPLAYLGKMKAIFLGVMFMGIIAASIYKIALVVKIAFIAKVIALIKALLAKKNHQEEQSWIPHGGHEEHHGGWDSGIAANAGWSRSRNEAQNLAYSAYQK